MISLELPEGNVLESVRSCANSIQNIDLVHRLTAIEAHFVMAEKIYDDCARNERLYTIAKSENVVGMISVDEMKGLYKNSFSKLGSSSRHLYDRIRSKAKICPLCNSRPVGTLDHYLAQSNHPIYVLTPKNLVPACSDCNKIKLAFNADALNSQTLHPYFDRLPVDQPWLKATILEGAPMGVIFSAEPPLSWGESLSARLIKHFERFGLAALYAAKASSEISVLTDLVEIPYVSYGPQGLKDHLELQASLRRIKTPHSWLPALYSGLAKSDWFVNGGFR